MSTAQRYAKAGTATWAGLWGNMLLALCKGIMGWLSGSKALLADAFRTAADAAEAAAAVSSQRTGRQRTAGKAGGEASTADSKGEMATTILMSVILLIVGLEIGISAIRDLSDGVHESPRWTALVVIGVSLIAQQLFLPSRDRMSALYCSLAALIGTGGAIIGRWLSVPELYYMDPAAALAIAAIIMYGGLRMATGSVKGAGGKRTEEENANEMMQLVQRVEGVITVQSLKAKEQGHYVVAEIVISVNPRITVLEGHEIAKRVKQLVMKRFIHVTDVSIFVEPYDPGYPYKSNHDPNQEQMPTLLQ